jgi:DNA primase
MKTNSVSPVIRNIRLIKRPNIEINERAKKVYHYILLNDKKAERAREYLKKRGLTLIP